MSFFAWCTVGSLLAVTGSHVGTEEIRVQCDFYSLHKMSFLGSVLWLYTAAEQFLMYSLNVCNLRFAPS